jgi:hypothetical protein
VFQGDLSDLRRWGLIPPPPHHQYRTTEVEYTVDLSADPADLLLKVDSVVADARAGISRMGSELPPSRSSNW